MHKAFPLPVIEFPLPGEVPTASEESSHWQKKRDATGEKIALLLKSSSNGSETLEQIFNRLQVIVIHLEFIDIEIEQDDLNQKFLTSLPLEWLMHMIKKSESNSQNMAFISLAKHNSGNEEVNNGSVSTASTNVSSASANIRVANISQDTTCAYITSQSSGKKISIQGTDVAGFDKSKVECFNCHKMGHFARGVGWDSSYMANDEENHALVSDEEAPTEFSLMAKTNAESEVFDNFLCSKAWLAQVEARLAEHRNQEVKYCEKIRILEFKTKSRANCIESVTKELELIKKEKEGLLEFADDTVTNYSRPASTVESSPDDAQNRNPSITATEASPSTITPKPFIKFVKASDRSTEIKTAKDKTAKPTVKYAGMYSKPSKSSNVRDSGCSRHMTGNISYLSNYEPFDGGYVSFGQGGCKITGKETIKTGKLEFENVYFVKDLKDFKLLDNANVLLRTLRRHNMYSIDLNNIFPHKDLTCLVAKASADEGMLWHRRLGHLNFKIMNKLVRHNLVRGLPTKCFENDHSCTAYLKGKQHKASWIKREFSNARTPQQNGIAERRNRTLIEAARPMLANAKLYVTFWAKAVNTACYVQNRVLVNKSKNKTPYELFNGRTPATGFLKPFGCYVMILNTLDNLGKFKAKGDEGYFIGYFMSSKAFRVFNKRTKRVEENLHVDFLENKAIKKGVGPNWLFDIYSLTKSMNYVPVVVTGTNSTNFSGTKDAARQEFEDILGVTTNSDESNRVEADVRNMETTITASPTPTLRIHKDHPKSQITGPVDTPIQTRHKFKKVREQSFIATVHQKTDPSLL
nr:ribonuclease H-like domain-containing protein [Tanacetum cinerariifolium]